MQFRIKLNDKDEYLKLDGIYPDHIEFHITSKEKATVFNKDYDLRAAYRVKKELDRDNTPYEYENTDINKYVDLSLPADDRIKKLTAGLYNQSLKEYISGKQTEDYNLHNSFKKIEDEMSTQFRYTFMVSVEAIAPLMNGMLTMIKSGEIEELKFLLEQQLKVIKEWHTNDEYQKFKLEQAKHREEQPNESNNI